MDKSFNMEIKQLLKLALNSLNVNKLRSILTMLGIIIGVFAIILLVSIGSGLQSYITKEIAGLGSNLIFVIPGRVGGARTPGGVITNKLQISDAKNIELRLKNEANISGAIQKTSSAKYKNKSDKGVSILGATANYPIIVKTEIQSGSFFSESQERSASKVALIGQTVLNNLFTEISPLGEKVSIGNNRYTIIGVLEKKGALFGIDQDNTIIIPVTTAQRQFGVTSVNTIYISAKTSDLIPFVENKAKEILLKRLTEDDFTLQTQESTLSTITNITNILSLALGGIAAISLLVGGVGVANIMLVSVTERTREIGIRKALGAKKIDILKQFLLEAVILSLSGGTIGIIFGVVASVVLARFFVSEVTFWSIFLAFGFSTVVGVVFGIFPAIRASRLSPIEALRYE